MRRPRCADHSSVKLRPILRDRLGLRKAAFATPGGSAHRQLSVRAHSLSIKRTSPRLWRVHASCLRVVRHLGVPPASPGCAKGTESDVWRIVRNRCRMHGGLSTADCGRGARHPEGGVRVTERATRRRRQGVPGLLAHRGPKSCSKSVAAERTICRSDAARIERVERALCHCGDPKRLHGEGCWQRGSAGGRRLRLATRICRPVRERRFPRRIRRCAKLTRVVKAPALDRPVAESRT